MPGTEHSNTQIHPDITNEFIAALGPDQVLTQEPLSKHTSFKIGGCAHYYLRPRSVEDVQEALRIITQHQLSWMVIGEGSDLLFSDEGFWGVIIELGPKFSKATVDGTTVWAQAGISMADLSDFCCQQGLSGFEFACGIPGTLGGGLFMNAGAYGGQMSDVVVRATVLRPTGELARLDFTGEDFGYRSSPIAEAGIIVLDASLELTPLDPQEIQATIDDLMERRRSKQPLDLPSAGSTFKRPANNYASALIDEAGLKGFRIGDAGVSEKHAGFVVNHGKARAADVLAVIAHVQAVILEQFEIELEPEVRIIPSHLDNAPRI